ncbi:MAG: hypothetical protein WCR52_18800 [Bacteroidota bacterium]
MEKIYCFFVFMSLLLFSLCNNAQAQTTNTAVSSIKITDSDQYFDPERDPIGLVQSDGSFLLTVSEAVLTRSLKTFMPQIGIVQKVVKQKIRGAEHIVFECRNINEPEKSLFVAIQLKKDEFGKMFADRQYNICSGNPCGDCKFTAGGCICAEQAPADDPTRMGSCNHTVSDRMGLVKVKIAQE